MESKDTLSFLELLDEMEKDNRKLIIELALKLEVIEMVGKQNLFKKGKVDTSVLMKSIQEIEDREGGFALLLKGLDKALAERFVEDINKLPEKGGNL